MSFNALNGNVLREGNVDYFMEGIDIPLTAREVNDGWHRFWNKNQLAVNEEGRVYRTTRPRKLPSKGKFDFRNERSKKTVLPRV